MNYEQLKNSILQEAIEGRLVPQDPNDEPAAVLLDRIADEKKRLIKEKKIKRDKNESRIYRTDDGHWMERFSDKNRPEVCIDDEIPFDIPEGWGLVRWNELGDYKKGPFGSSLTKSMFVPKSDDSVKVYEQKNAIQKNFSIGSYYISREKYKSMEGFTVNAGDIIVSCAGTIGETYVLPKEAPIGIINQALMRAKIFKEEIIPYWLLFWDYILNVKNALNGKGSAIKNIPPFSVLKQILVPIPPIQEQNRIINKYKILIAKARTFGEAQDRLDALNTALPEKLKASVLQEAIEGRLVEQNPDDEPASKLLDRIAEEKTKLVKEKKIKADKNASRIYRTDDGHWMEHFADIHRTDVCIDDDIPFDIPDNWEWCRLQQICSLLSRGKSPKYLDTDRRYPVFAQKCNLKEGGISLAQARFLNPSTLSRWPEEYHLKTGDVLVNSTGTGTVGRTRLFDESVLGDYPFVVPDSHVSVIRTFDDISSEYIYSFISSKRVQDYFEDNLKGATNQKELYIVVLQNLLIPLPPKEEQKRIISKLKEIIPTLDSLK